MSEHIHFIVARCRTGWAVNVDADLLSEHSDLRAAREEARRLTDWAQSDGVNASMVDLSSDESGA